ncbi:unnamed protein product [Musa acuminata subsp. malaccensis]|nr:unnamed protein product [Musa acuminata subsp. malaccensis]
MSHNSLVYWIINHFCDFVRGTSHESTAFRCFSYCCCIGGRAWGWLAFFLLDLELAKVLLAGQAAEGIVRQPEAEGQILGTLLLSLAFMAVSFNNLRTGRGVTALICESFGFILISPINGKKVPYKTFFLQIYTLHTFRFD